MTREEAREILDKMPLCNECDSSNFLYTCVECGDAFQMAMEALKQPEIVRCKDCEMNNQCSIQFKFATADNQEEWFCGYGKPKN